MIELIANLAMRHQGSEVLRQGISAMHRAPIGARQEDADREKRVHGEEAIRRNAQRRLNQIRAVLWRKRHQCQQATPWRNYHIRTEVG